VILCASMSAVAAALSSLGSTSVVDFYRVTLRPGQDDAHYLAAGRGFVVLWGLVAIGFALLANQADNLIQAVNILGSIFYGPMLGAFLVGFFVTRVQGTAVFIATLVAQATVIIVWQTSSIGWLWYNVIGCGVVVIVALIAQRLVRAKIGSSPARVDPPT
jgi:SSS family solute:Na+ symporter